MAGHARSMASPLADMVRFPGAFEGARAGVDRCRARGIQKSPALSRTPRPLARLAVDASPQGSGGGAGPRPVPRRTSGPRVGVQRAGSAVAMAAVAQKHVQGASCGPGPAHGPFGGPFGLGGAGGVALEFRVDHRGRGGRENTKTWGGSARWSMRWLRCAPFSRAWCGCCGASLPSGCTARCWTNLKATGRKTCVCGPLIRVRCRRTAAFSEAARSARRTTRFRLGEVRPFSGECRRRWRAKP